MFGWSISASAWRSASKRAMTSFVSMPELDDLERDAAAHRLLLLGHVDDAAAALADLLQQLVGADSGAGGIVRRRRLDIPGDVRNRRRLQKVADLLVGVKERFHPPEEFGVAAARLLQIALPLRHRQRERGGKQLFVALGGLTHEAMKPSRIMV